jgi:hypothetical protein
LPLLVGGKTQAACTSAGGTPYDIGSGVICRFASGNCRGGWTQHLSWSATESVSYNGLCGNPDTGATGSNCGTGSHAFSNAGTEGCSWINGFAYEGCSWGATVADTQTGLASVVAIGCK